MKCNKCGADLEQNKKFCGECGARVEIGESIPVENNFQATTPQEFQGRNVIENSSSKKSLLVPLVIAISSVVVVFGICLAFVMVSMLGGNLAVEVDAYPATTQSTSLVLSGRASAQGANATISINGEFVGNVAAKQKDQYWSKEVSLKDGKNNFIITVTDAKGNADTKNIEIECDSQVVYKEGTILVKHNSSGVYIRPNPQISNKYIMLIDRNDYTSQFVCLGEESTDTEGYIWCKVRTPNKGIGWVRSDLMRVLN